MQNVTISVAAPELTTWIAVRGPKAPLDGAVATRRALFAFLAAAGDHADLTVDFMASTGRKILLEHFFDHTRGMEGGFLFHGNI